MVVAKVEQQIIAMVRDNWCQESVYLVVSDFHAFSSHRIPEDAFPDVVVVLVQVPYYCTLITTLVAIFILEKGHEVSYVHCHWTKVFALVPLALVFSDTDVALTVVLCKEDLFENENQVIQMFDRLIVDNKCLI